MERDLATMDPNYMWICQETKNQEEGHHLETEMEVKDQQNVFGAKNKATKSSNAQTF